MKRNFRTPSDNNIKKENDKANEDNFLINTKYLSNKDGFSNEIQYGSTIDKKFEKLSSGFKTNSIKSDFTADNILDKEVNYVFQHVKENIQMRENLDKYREMNIGENNLQSILQDDRIKELSNEIKNEYIKLNEIVSNPQLLTPVEDPFGIKRGICQMCLDDCKGYSPFNFNQNNTASLCSSCNCGATLHQPLEMDSFSFNSFTSSVKNEILPILQTPTFSDNDINFNSFLVIFQIEEFDRNEINNFLNLLKDGGFNILTSDIKTINLNQNSNPGEEFEMLRMNMSKYYGNTITNNISNNLLNSQNLNMKDSINFNKYEMSKIFLKDSIKLDNTNKDTTFDKVNKMSKIYKNLTTNGKLFINDLMSSKEINKNDLIKSQESFISSNILNKSKFFSQLKNKIHSDFEIKSKYVEILKKPVLILCLANSKGIEYFEKFYHAIKNNQKIKNSIAKNLHLAYYSKSKMKALWDLQAIFPNLFTIQKDISIISEKPNLYLNTLDNNTIYMKDSFNSFLNNTSLNYLTKKSKKENFIGQSYLMSSVENLNHKEIKTNKNQISNFQKSLSQYKDFLISNSITLTSKLEFENVNLLIEFLKTNSNEKSNFVKNLIKYISNNELEIHTAISFTNRLGNSKFNNLEFSDKLDIKNFKSFHEIEILSNLFFNKETSYSRVMLIFRPIIVRNGLVDVILNIFKLNNFFILKRKVLILNKIQSEILYQSEFPGENKILEFDDYFKMMSDFNVEIVILSKFGAFEESKLLCGTGIEGFEGEIKNIETNVNLLNSVNSVLSKMDLFVQYEVDNDLIHKNDKIKKTIYQEKIENNIITNNFNSFNDVTSLLNVNKIIDGIVSDTNYKNKNYQILLDIKRNIIRFCSLFNIFVYNSRNIETVNQEISFFFHEFGSIQETFVMLKPNKDKLSITHELIVQNIKETFEKMNYEILDSVKYKMNEDEFGNLFDKYFTNNLLTPYQYSQSKDIFMNNEIEILRLVKTGGMVDMTKIIGKENYEFVKFSENNQNNLDYEKLKIIKENCYLLNLSSDIEYYFPIVNDLISIVEGGYLIKHAEDVPKINSNSNFIIQVLNSCIKCTIGEYLRFDPTNTTREKLINRYLKFFHYDDENKINEKFINVLEHYMFSKWNKTNDYNDKFFEFLFFNKDSINTFIAFFLESNDLGFYEVRIPILENLIDNLDFNIARNYLYSDKHFFKELKNKYNSDKIISEILPFSLSYDLESNEMEWMKTHLDLEEINEEELLELGLNLNLEKIKDNLGIIKKRLFYKTKFEMSRIFNLMCHYLCDDNDNIQIAPKNYHYRIKPDDITMDIRRIYEVEEFSGLFFIEVISQDFIKYRTPEWENNSEKKIDQFRYSLPTFLWGRKLSKICERLNQTNPISDNVDDCGPLIFSTKDQKLKGTINSKYLIEYEQYLFINILYDLKNSHDKKIHILFDIFNESQFKIVEEKLLELLNSEIFIKSRSQEIVMSPMRINENNLRISKRRTLSEHKSDNMENELKFHEYFKQNEEMRINNDIANKNVVLTDLFLTKSSKFRSYSCFQYLLNIIYKKISRKSYLLQNNEEEYDKMIEALLIGFNKNINFDLPEVNDTKLINAYKMEYFLYILSEIKFMLNDLNVSSFKLKNVEENIKIISSYQWQNKILNKNNQSQNNLNDYEKMKSLLKNNINELNMNIEILFYELLNYDFRHLVTVKENSKFYVVPKERYHIPMHFEEYWERNVNDDKFKYKKVYDKSYLMDYDVVRALSKSYNVGEVFVSGSFRSSKNYLTLTKNMLREPIKEISKEIIIEKKKDENKKHPIKLLAEMIRKQNNI